MEQGLINDEYELFERYCIMTENGVSEKETMDTLELMTSKELIEKLVKKVIVK
jgi:hypothetical protein